MQYIAVTNYDFNLRLSEHFTLGEFIQSETAFKNKVIMQYVHQQHIVDNIQYLVKDYLQPAREAIGDAIIITSGYRASATNSLVGGAKNSLHLHGLAADLWAGSKNNMLVEFFRERGFHELYVYKNRIHISVKQLWNEGKFRDYR